MASLSPPTLEMLGPTLSGEDRLLGLDVGTKTIGLALSDVSRSIATPLKTIRRGKFTLDAAEIARIVTAEGVAALVVGLPINMDGTEGPRAQSARAFGRNLAPIVGRPILFWDERLSTAASERALLEADTSRARRAELIDKMAAAWILQGALDRLRNIEKS